MSKEAKNTQVGGDHYQSQPVQPWDVIDNWPLEQQIGYHRGNILKYTMRMGLKAGQDALTEARKIAHYAQKLTEVIEHGERRQDTRVQRDKSTRVRTNES